MPLFFFDIEPEDEQPGAKGTAPSKASEIVALRFYEMIRSMSTGSTPSGEAQDAEQAEIEQTKTDTTSS